jgi:oxygen-independent coproporphyrinogen-3 oxidase
VYVHVPFCEHVCPYCDFAVLAVGRLGAPDEDQWVELVLKEWERWREAVASRPVASVYFGGGTPSLLRAKSLERVLAALAAALRFDSPEITVELNPGQLEVARVPELRALGVTRLSIGLQSTDDTGCDGSAARTARTRPCAASTSASTRASTRCRST